jgi:hypothetical protein
MTWRSNVVGLVVSMSLGGCGAVGALPDGGADGGADASTGSGGDADTDGGAADAGIPLAQRQAAATQTARSHALCVAIAPFYWEIGDGAGLLGSDVISGPDGSAPWTGTTVMPIASASKWLYSSAWVERVDGGLTPTDLRFLTFQSGYSRFTRCPPTASVVDDCLTGLNGSLDPATVNRFAYGGGHMQQHASLNGLGRLDEAGLAAELERQLGSPLALSFNSPQPAGGVTMSAAEYATVLRRMLRGELAMSSALGTHAVCASALDCPSLASSPAPPNERWSYSIGHWVEVDAVVGDGAFSSAGAFGFYPWIDATKSLYGVVARVESAGGGFDSVRCGRLIRKAWVTGAAVQ